MNTRIPLYSDAFQPQERILASAGGLQASAFRFSSGVNALRLANQRGEVILLPFQGQQVWSAIFDGASMGMRSMFSQPWPTREYLQTYGGLVLHCGFTAMGVPGVGDTHPLHGELPNAPYQEAFLELGEDENGAFMALGGSMQHTVAFNCHYQAEPLTRLRSGAARIECTMRFTNLKQTPMEYMYLAHINVRPVNNSRLVYSAHATPEHVRVRRSIPSHVHPQPGYAKFLEELARDPARHHILAQDLQFDPEVVFFIDYLPDSQGWAHSLQVHPDGNADWVAHRIAELPIGSRWICRTPDQDALGVVLPSTAETEGYHAEKAKGLVKTLGPGSQVEMAFTLGRLNPAETQQKEHLIQTILSQR
jgi:hypothetical protein